MILEKSFFTEKLFFLFELTKKNIYIYCNKIFVPENY